MKTESELNEGKRERKDRDEIDESKERKRLLQQKEAEMKKILIIKGLTVFTESFIRGFLHENKMTNGEDVEEVRVARFGNERWVYLQFKTREDCEKCWKNCQFVKVPGVVIKHSWRQLEQRVLKSQGNYPNGQRTGRRWTWLPIAREGVGDDPRAC